MIIIYDILNLYLIQIIKNPGAKLRVLFESGGVIFVVFGINFAFRCPVGGATGHLVSIL